MDKDLSLEESRRILSVAADVRPDGNVHQDPSLSAPRVARGRAVTAEESRRIMALATNVRPLENVHPDEEEDDDPDEPTGPPQSRSRSGLKSAAAPAVQGRCRK